MTKTELYKYIDSIYETVSRMHNEGRTDEEIENAVILRPWRFTSAELEAVRKFIHERNSCDFELPLF